MVYLHCKTCIFSVFHIKLIYFQDLACPISNPAVFQILIILSPILHYIVDNSNSSATPPATQTTLSNSLIGQSTPNSMTAGNTSLPTTPINKVTGHSQSHINGNTSTVVNLSIKPTLSMQAVSTNFTNGTATTDSGTMFPTLHHLLHHFVVH